MPTLPLGLATLDTITLPPPILDETAPLVAALRSRRSTRAFAPDPMSMTELATVLWCGFGVNRPDSGGRTAPSAHDWQEIDVHAVLPEGCFRYDAIRHRLALVRTGDLRADTGRQDFVADAPLNLVYVADFARMPDANPRDREFLAAADAGCIAQNVYLACAALGLATVVRGLVDRKRLAAAMKLSAQQRIVLAQSVGHHAA